MKIVLIVLSKIISNLVKASDIFEAGESIDEIGKYKIMTKCFTDRSEKFDLIKIHYDNVQDWYFTNCVGVEPLGATVQTIAKKKTHLATEEQIKSVTARFYYRFKFI